MKKKLLWFFLLAWFPAVGWASEAYEYATVAVDALNTVQEAAKVNRHKLDSKANSSFEQIRAIMGNSVAQSHAFALAGIHVKRFTKSNDKDIRESATDLDAAFLMLKTSSEQISTVCEKFLNNPLASTDTMGTTMRGMLELQEQAKTNWEVYAKVGSSAITSPLVSSDRLVKGGVHYLKITKAEREKLKAQLLLAFGPSVKTADDTTPMYRLPATMMWKFLNDRWEPADSKP